MSQLSSARKDVRIPKCVGDEIPPRLQGGLFRQSLMIWTLIGMIRWGSLRLNVGIHFHPQNFLCSSTLGDIKALSPLFFNDTLLHFPQHMAIQHDLQLLNIHRNLLPHMYLNSQLLSYPCCTLPARAMPIGVSKHSPHCSPPCCT